MKFLDLETNTIHSQIINDQTGLAQQMAEMAVYWSEYEEGEEGEGVSSMHVRLKSMALRALASVSRDVHSAPVIARTSPSLIPDICEHFLSKI